MPELRGCWSAMNIFVTPGRSAVMCTAWQSRIEARGREAEFSHPTMPERPLLQTWNPQALDKPLQVPVTPDNNHHRHNPPARCSEGCWSRCVVAG